MLSEQIRRLPAPRPGRFRYPRRATVDAEILAAIVLLAAVLVVGLATVGDYGITIDEFNADDYGPKSLAWYSSGFTDRSSFETVEDTLWYYGPWSHMLIAAVQSLGIGDHWTVRHVVTFLTGLAGLAAIVPIGRLAVGRWAGLVALVLCLTTGYLYGSIFFTPIDVPFLLAMTWSTLAIIVMAGRVVPSWPATVAAGLLTGLAIATRSSGLIAQVYLLLAMGLCALAALGRPGGTPRRDLLRIGARTVGALTLGWMTAYALWPWLQIGNPLVQFKLAFDLFANHPNSFEMPVWGVTVTTTDLPWWYVPAQLLARLPEGFLLLLASGILLAVAAAFGFSHAGLRALRRRGPAGLRAAVVLLARSRRYLLVWAAVVLPLGFIMVRHSTLYDGVRHVLFVIPMLAVIAGAGFLRLPPARPPRAADRGGDGRHLCRVLDLDAGRPASARIRRHERARRRRGGRPRTLRSRLLGACRHGRAAAPREPARLSEPLCARPAEHHHLPELPGSPGGAAVPAAVAAGDRAQAGRLHHRDRALALCGRHRGRRPDRRGQAV